MSIDQTSREHLLHLLAEAAELEHNLLLSYLYAAFSLKQEADEDIEPLELAAVQRWRQAIMAVCSEEMNHLAQIANLTSAIGSLPHFNRPNMPVDPGYHPARIQVRLAPFDLEALDHFIFLERPAGSAVQDPEAYRGPDAQRRDGEVGVLMPSAPDYDTIGGFYETLEAQFKAVANALGEQALFVGVPGYQLLPSEVGSAALLVVTDLATALRALELIVVQGEGAREAAKDSHFETFRGIREELLGLQARRPAFRPGRDVAHDPVMRRPTVCGRQHITHPEAAALLDAANAVYSLLLACLTAVYRLRADEPSRAPVLKCAISAMAVMSLLSGVLTRLPAASPQGPRAGITFAMPRSVEGLGPEVDMGRLLAQQARRIAAQVAALPMPGHVALEVAGLLERAAKALEQATGRFPAGPLLALG